MRKKILDIQQLRLSIGGQLIIDTIDLNLHLGETVALLGESGCGKSMTALSIPQLLPNGAHFGQDSHIQLDDISLLQCSEVAMRRIRGKRIGMIFQEPMSSLNPVLTAGEQLEEVLKQHETLSRLDRYSKITTLLQSVGLDQTKRIIQSYPHQLSGGMKQRIMIAIAIATQPHLLIADEPTTALDVTVQSQILTLLRSVQQQMGMGILFITHNLHVAHQIAQRIIVMYAGHFIEQAPTSHLFSAPKHPYTQQLFAAVPSLRMRNQRLASLEGEVPKLRPDLRGCRFAKRCSYAFDACFEISPKWLSLGNDHFVRCHLYDEDQKAKRANTSFSDSIEKLPETNQPVQRQKKTILRIENLQVHFPIRKGFFKRTVGWVKAVDGIHLELLSGQTLALVGGSGCGKTTIGKSIVNLVKPTAGRIIYRDRVITETRNTHFQSDPAIQMIFQDPFSAMNPRLLVRDILMEGLRAQGKCLSNNDKQIEACLETVHLPKDSLYRYPHEFSGGQRQRLCIARTLLLKPELLICDEPTSALDVSVQAHILNLLKTLQTEHQLTYLFITHDLSVVSYLADTVAVMQAGKIVEQGPTQQILESPQHEFTKRLLSAAFDSIS